MQVMNDESFLMKIASTFGLHQIRWQLRRLHVPAQKDALVLEIGAGGNPYPRANVLLDGFENSIERIEEKLVKDRPFVLGVCEKLPFKNKTFDFIIASHVLEHTDDPKSFLNELQRVGKAGYIETPDAFFERINPYTYHRLEICSQNQKLIIRKKTNWKVDSELVELYENKLKKSTQFQKYIRTKPDAQHLRYYWNEKIDFTILNPEVDANWEYPQLVKPQYRNNSLKGCIRDLNLKVIRKLFSQNKRNKTIDIMNYLQCVKCDNSQFEKEQKYIKCKVCSQVYPIDNGSINFTLNSLNGANKVRSQMDNKS